MTYRVQERIMWTITRRSCATATARHFVWHLGAMFLAMVRRAVHEESCSAGRSPRFSHSSRQRLRSELPEIEVAIGRDMTLTDREHVLPQTNGGALWMSSVITSIDGSSVVT